MSKTKKKGKVIKWVIIVFVLLFIAGAVFYVKNMGGSTEPKLICDSAPVKKQDLTQYVSFTGAVSGKNSVSVTGDPTLKVQKLNVKKGDSVKKGDILCVFDSTSLEEEFNSLSDSNSKAQGAQNYTHGINQRNLENARRDKASALAKAQRDIDDAYSKRDKAYDDYNNKVNKYNEINRNIDTIYAEMIESESEDEAKAKEAEYESLRAQAAALNTEIDMEHEQLSAYDDAITAAKRAYEDIAKSSDNLIQNAQDVIDQEQYTNTDTSASDRLKKLSEQIEKCTVTAPMDGIITSLSITEGSVPMTADIMTISDASSLIVTGLVNEVDILNVKENQKAEITTTATGDEIISGKVKRVERISTGGSAETAGGYTVEISVDEPEKLLIGMNASAKIVLDEVSDVLSVPYDSIHKDDNDESYVWLATDNQNGSYRVSKVVVKPGFEGDYYTEITSGSLKPNDIVLTGGYSLTEGDMVELYTSEEE